MIELRPECGLRLFLRSSLHITPATDIGEKSLQSWLASIQAPPLQKNTLGGGDETHPSPENI